MASFLNRSRKTRPSAAGGQAGRPWFAMAGSLVEVRYRTSRPVDGSGAYRGPRPHNLLEQIRVAGRRARWVDLVLVPVFLALWAWFGWHQWWWGLMAGVSLVSWWLSPVERIVLWIRRRFIRRVI